MQKANFLMTWLMWNKTGNSHYGCDKKIWFGSDTYCCTPAEIIWASTLENRSSGFPTRSDTNWTVQLLNMAKGLKFWIYEVEGLYYPCSKNKDADQLRGYREADLRLCFRIMQKYVVLTSRLISDLNFSSFLKWNKAVMFMHQVENWHSNDTFNDT